MKKKLNDKIQALERPINENKKNILTQTEEYRAESTIIHYGRLYIYTL